MIGLRRFNLFVDLDGCLADFDKGFMEMCGATMPMRETNEDAAWEAIKKAPNFWRRLQPMPGAIAFWEFLKPFNPCILTSPSKNDTDRGVIEKRQWVDNWLGTSTPVFFRRAKFKHHLASPDAILIDDFEPNILNWRNAGGHPILHQNIETTKQELLRLASLEDIHSYIRTAS